jgi:TPR repeat protein
MEDIAHDASGPSPEPGEIAPQQARRADSPDRGKLRVFISYSRDDLDFADQLNAALDACGFECFIDRQGISGGEDWKRRLGNLIRDADTVVFVLSPTSARSEICAWEVEEAARLGKRILPVICQPLRGVSPPPRLRDLNYIFFHADPKVPGSGFGTGLATLVAALNTDFDWLREHTRYLQRATEWDRGGRPANRLLSGDDIAEAKAWVARRPKNAPEPTALHLDFIRASEEEAEARSSAQRKQLEEIAAAQAERETALHEAEEALKQAADAQRRRARIRNIAFVVVSIFAVLAGWLYWNAAQQRKVAEEQRAVAQEQRAVAEEQRAVADRILEGATGIIWRSLLDQMDQMDIDSKKDILAVFHAGADHGDATSMSVLGWLYHEGRGVVQDYAKAREWFEKAADKGHGMAMLNLGQYYHFGWGGAQDYAKAREWYEKAADKGEEAVMFNLGMLYYNSQGGAQDYAKARDWWEKAADKGSATAMLNLGLLYTNGQGVARDYAKAREWFQKAADKGETDAMANLGVLYANGYGVTQDYAKAHEWFQKAADKGNADATFYLGLLYDNGFGVAQDYAKAHEWYEKAAAKDNANAMRNLGVLYANGYGVAQDYAKAHEWYEKAADKGDADARDDLEKLAIEEAAAAGRYVEALQLQQTLAEKVEAVETEREGKPGKETAGALYSVAWYALFAQEFTKALTAADRVHALVPDDHEFEINRAHALMFLERGAESKALYLAHKGKPVSEDGKLWERAIVEDFAEFDKAGLTHPMMADIEKELGVSR